MTLYAELDGIWHVVDDGQTVCGHPFVGASELDFEPKPVCWRCREASWRQGTSLTGEQAWRK